MTILGITGGIGSGKSTVAAMLTERGVPIVSADDVARSQMQPGSAVSRAVLEAFPQCAELQNPQSVNRSALATRIFADDAARARLEVLTHPPIIAALRDTAAAWRVQNSAGCAALEIPLLFEAHLEALVDKIVVVTCDAQTQVSRLQARWGITQAEASRRTQAQWPLSEKAARAHCVITTDGTLDDTRRQVDLLWRECCQ